MLKIGKFEYCSHKPCVCGGLGGYVKMTEVVEKYLGQKVVGMEEVQMHEPVFKYSWLWPRKVMR